MRYFRPNFSCECRIKLKFCHDVLRVIPNNFRLWPKCSTTLFEWSTGLLCVFGLGFSRNRDTWHPWSPSGALGTWRGLWSVVGVCWPLGVVHGEEMGFGWVFKPLCFISTLSLLIFHPFLLFLPSFLLLAPLGLERKFGRLVERCGRRSQVWWSLAWWRFVWFELFLSLSLLSLSRIPCMF